MVKKHLKKCLICNSYDMDFVEKLLIKPSKETDFLIPKEEYKRTIKKCKNCGVYLNQYDHNLDSIYKRNYNERTYSNSLTRHFDKIMSFPYHKSDNKQRVKRVKKYISEKSKLSKSLNILDIGSGLCVFLAELKKYYNNVTCIDPSSEAISHTKNHVGIANAYRGNFDDFIFTKKFDLITLNKVLEHVKNPIEVLLKVKTLLNPKGFVYIEVPDAYNSSKNGGFINREEFYIEHHTIFNLRSLKYLVGKVKLKIEKIESIHEPSDKYTIYAFLSF